MTVIHLQPLQKKEAECSFCGVKRACVHSSVSDKAVCYACVQNIEEATGDIPFGAICCLRCKSFTSFWVEYTNGTRANYVALQAEGQEVMYAMKSCTGPWSADIPKKKVYCESCGARVPQYILERTTYIP